ncbi:MAG: GtrA family protein [Clostridia bacterium]|nr:GtrA family protein [Clostridia bacterium]
MPQTATKQTLWQAVKFTLFSASAGIIQVGSFSLIHEVILGKAATDESGLSYWVPYLVSLILSVVWNFTFNRRYTFKSAANVPIAMAKVFGFYCVFTPVSTLLGNYFAQAKGTNDYLILAVTMISNLVLEYLFCKFVVYRGQENNR